MITQLDIGLRTAHHDLKLVGKAREDEQGPLVRSLVPLVAC